MNAKECQAKLVKLANSAGSADRTDAFRQAAALVGQIKTPAKPAAKKPAKATAA